MHACTHVHTDRQTDRQMIHMHTVTSYIVIDEVAMVSNLKYMIMVA